MTTIPGELANCCTLVVVVISLACLTAAPASATDEVVISDDGGQIQLHGDGTWVQLSKDRFATNAAGQRVRLKADGTWTLIDEDRLQTASVPQVTPLSPLTAASESTLHLTRVEILKRRIRRAKSTHAETSTVYYLQVVNDSGERIRLSEDLTQALRATSSSGGEYPVTSVTYEREDIAPGERVNITIAAAGAPRWFGVKRMLLEVAPGALGNTDLRVLSKDMADVERRSVDNL